MNVEEELMRIMSNELSKSIDNAIINTLLSKSKRIDKIKNILEKTK